MRFIDISGQKFDRLTVVQFLGNRQWLCICECGNKRKVYSPNLRSGHTKSCGCLSSETVRARRIIHNRTGTTEYNSWFQLIRRCTRKSSDKWKHYGARGIGVCDRWRYGENGTHGFECFLADMGKRPTPKHTLDRIDNNSDYFPENCRWVTQKINCGNRRSNVKITFNGQEMILNDAFDAAHGSSKGYDCLYANYFRRRKSGMAPQEAFDTTIAKMHKLRESKMRRSYSEGRGSA